MGRTYDTDAAGRPTDLIGKPLEYRLAPIPGTGVGVRVIGQEEYIPMTKAEKTGEYVIDGNYFVIRAGDPVPDGAEVVEERAEKAAPENRAEKAAPQNRSAKPDKKAD